MHMWSDAINMEKIIILDVYKYIDNAWYATEARKTSSNPENENIFETVATLSLGQMGFSQV